MGDSVCVCVFSGESVNIGFLLACSTTSESLFPPLSLPLLFPLHISMHIPMHIAVDKSICEINTMPCSVCTSLWRFFTWVLELSE